jgi:mRNA interferase RelE/StbE
MDYKLIVLDHLRDLLRGLHPLLKSKIKKALKKILADPSAGKKLQDELQGLRSFRVKRFRIIYQVNKQKQIELVAIGSRKIIYEETFRIISKEER